MLISQIRFERSRLRENIPECRQPCLVFRLLLLNFLGL